MPSYFRPVPIPSPRTLTLAHPQVREIMASLGFRTMEEMVGRADMLDQDHDAVKANPKVGAVL